MSWHITVYPRQFHELYEACSSQRERDELMENPSKQPVLSKDALVSIEKHLKRRKYIPVEDGRRYEHGQYPGAEAMLTENALYFTGKGEDGVMEVSMTSGEFVGTMYAPQGMFAVYDMQDDRWSV